MQVLTVVKRDSGEFGLFGGAGTKSYMGKFYPGICIDRLGRFELRILKFDGKHYRPGTVCSYLNGEVYRLASIQSDIGRPYLLRIQRKITVFYYIHDGKPNLLAVMNRLDEEKSTIALNHLQQRLFSSVVVKVLMTYSTKKDAWVEE